MIELLPCPFCGGEAHFFDLGVDFVVCDSCDAAMFGETMDDAINKWNHRTPIKTEPCPYCDERFWVWDSEYYNNHDDAYTLFKNNFCPECGKKIDK